MKSSLPILFAALGLAACTGTVPERNGSPYAGVSAMLIGCKVILPSGETRNAQTEIGIESGDGERAQVYRLPLSSGESYLYVVEPGSYHLAPPLGFFGGHLPYMTAVIEGRTYRVPFPRELMRLSASRVKPGKATAIGTVELRVSAALPGKLPEVRVRLDDSVAARRAVVQNLIHDMLDPTKSAEARDSAVSWNQALQGMLMSILAEEERRPLYKAAP
jgi:hypothetical protein